MNDFVQVIAYKINILWVGHGIITEILPYLNLDKILICYIIVLVLKEHL